MYRRYPLKIDIKSKSNDSQIGHKSVNYIDDHDFEYNALMAFENTNITFEK